MTRLTNGLIVGLNVVTIVLALTAIGFAAAYYGGGNKTPCQKFLRGPLMGLGFMMLAMAAMGILGSWYRNSFLLWMYLFVMFLVIVGVTGLTIFSILVLNKSVGYALSGKVTKHKVADYSTWLQRRVVTDEHWETVRSCFLGSTKMCFKEIPTGKDEAYYIDNLSPLLSGCCKPPTDCEFGFKNATYWEVPKTDELSAKHHSKDCKTWSNDQQELCFDCLMCRLAYNDHLRNKWGVTLTVDIFLLAFVIAVYVVGVFALRNNREEVKKCGIRPRHSS